MVNPIYKEYGNYSGPMIPGVTEYIVPKNADHWTRVFAITSKIESNAKFGSVNLYDGTTVTAGLHQAILTYPKELVEEDFSSIDDQGSLVKLLRLFEFLPQFPDLVALKTEFQKQGWYISPDNKLLYSKGKTVTIKGKSIAVMPGQPVFGAELRDTITPGGNGKVPRIGPQWQESCRWAMLFHKVFANPVTYPVQVKFGVEHSVHACKTVKLANSLTIFQFIYGSQENSEPFADCPELDLAMCLYWCNSVNAPGQAKKLLDQVIHQTGFTGYKTGNKKEFAKALIKTLATSSYGRWSYEVAGGRYQRARNALMEIAKTHTAWTSEHFALLGAVPKVFR